VDAPVPAFVSQNACNCLFHILAPLPNAVGEFLVRTVIAKAQRQQYLSTMVGVMRYKKKK
jgi:hypothetical protein